MRGAIKIATVTVWVLVLFCRSPFFPQEGDPIEKAIESMRQTPRGLLDQIIEAYESKQIELYKDLFPDDGSFRFFVAPDYFGTFKQRYEHLSEPRDTRLWHLDASDYYYYWPQSVEIENHYKLFSAGVTIDFIDKPTLMDVRRFIDEGDTAAELKVTGGVLEITRLIGDTAEVYTSRIDKQVMLAKKDADNLWVLLKWYDFSRGE